MRKSTEASPKKRGRPATGRDPLLNFRSPAELTARIDTWAAQQTEPRPTRSQAIRRLLEDRLHQESALQSDVSLDSQIADQEAAIVEMPEPKGPSPAAGMAAMDKAIAGNDLIDMKNKRTSRKNAMRERRVPSA
jgi:hypothetical protein